MIFSVLFGTSAGILCTFRWLTEQHKRWEGQYMVVARYNWPLPLVGSLRLRHLRLSPVSTMDTALEWYECFDDDDAGVFFHWTQPVLVVKSPALAREILENKLDSFVNRDLGCVRAENVCGLEKSLPLLRGDCWKKTRAVLDPAFDPITLSKLGPSLVRNGAKFATFLRSQVERSGTGDVEMKGLFERHSLAVVADAIYGVSGEDALTDNLPTDLFLQNIQSARANCNSTSSLRYSLSAVAYAVLPSLASILGLTYFNPYPLEHLSGITKILERQRRQTGFKGADLLQVLLSTEAKDDFELMSQTQATFVTMGMELTSATLSMACYHLALNQGVQEKARKEVDAAASAMPDSNKEEGALDVQDLDGLKYLEMVLKETMRLNPARPLLQRACAEDCVLESGMHLPEGTLVIISAAGMQSDDKFWKDPAKFDPERFADGRKESDSEAFLPFGAGKRRCLAEEFAMMEMKVALFSLLRTFKMAPSKWSLEKAVYSCSEGVAAIKGGNWLRLEKRQ